MKSAKCHFSNRLITAVALFVILCSSIKAQPRYDYVHMQREKLGRGLVAVPTGNGDSICISWRYLDTDSQDVAFNLYRDGKQLNKQPLTTTTCFWDKATDSSKLTEYKLHVVVYGVEEAHTAAQFILKPQATPSYISIPLSRPSEGVTPDGRRYWYNANDCSVGDVDGDGEYEIIVKWEPSNAHDNAHNGYTGNVLFDCYTLDGKRLWRIDLGRNIRAGAHYTQFLVYDFDGDGKAEMICKTSDGCIDGEGNVIGDKDANYVEPNGRIYTGSEYLTVFDGMTGKALCTVDYVPQRGNISLWGDSNANRSERYLAAVAYLDGMHPSAVMCRGYYTRTVLAAWTWDGKHLSQQWTFDSNIPQWHSYAGQGNHNLRVADVDADGCDEIVYGSMCVDNDGNGLYNTRLGHGDAMHLYAFFPDSDKLQVWDIHENRRDGSTFRDAATGKVLHQIRADFDVGRGMAADIDPTNWGLEMWSTGSPYIYNVKGETIAGNRPSINFAVWWDGDLCRELLDGTRISKYDPQTHRANTIIDFANMQCAANNGSKNNPCLSADIIGDWREEVILRTRDNNELRIFISTLPTSYRFHTFMQDIPYRLSVATENVAYNQPPEPAAYFGSDVKKGQKMRGTQF